MNHRQYRNREEIIGSILESADKPEGMSKTRIMFNCFLSYTQLTEYLDHLVISGLLENDTVGKSYKTTLKGLDFLDLYNKMEAIAKAP